MGSGGIIFNPILYIGDFGPLNRAFLGKKLQHDFPNLRGGSKAVWIFPKIDLFW